MDTRKDLKIARRGRIDKEGQEERNKMQDINNNQGNGMSCGICVEIEDEGEVAQPHPHSRHNTHNT